MSATLPSDEVQMEQALRAAIRDTFMSVPLVVRFVKFHMRERFPDNSTEDEALSSVADPTGVQAFTSIIQIGIPRVTEFEKTGDHHTQLDLVYPITFDMEVVDQWAEQGPPEGLEYDNSHDLFTALYMKSRRAFKFNRDFGYADCVHDYLQLEQVGTATIDEESGGKLHSGDMSLTVHCTGVLV